MNSVEHAIQIVRDSVKSFSGTEVISLKNAIGRTLSKGVASPLNLPSFRQSAMDGYALNLHDSDSYEVIGEVKAGDPIDITLKPGQASRIFTGARVPNSANSIVIQEKVSREGDQLKLEAEPKTGDFIRNIGEQIAKGSIPLDKGHTINPSSLGLLKSLGIQEVEVVKNMKAAIIVTGNELVESGKDLKEGQIYESNSAVIEAALKAKGIQEINQITVRDNLEDTISKLRTALDENDLVLLSGGISVGEYDFVGQALKALEVEELFYKVLQKPGKPLFFGKRGETYVFALPGNPASTLTCFYVYVNLLIDLFKSAEHPGLLRVKFPIAQDYDNKFGRALFLKARVNNNSVEILDHQASSTMISFAKANALVYIPAEVTEVQAGDLVETIILPYGS